MKKGTGFTFALASAAAIVAVQAAPANAQRYCQRELDDGTATDEGCTAPVGGGITRTDPSRGYAASTQNDESIQDLNAIVETASQ